MCISNNSKLMYPFFQYLYLLKLLIFLSQVLYVYSTNIDIIFFQVNGNWYIAFFLIKPFITKAFYKTKCATNLYSSDSINGKYVCFHSKMLGFESPSGQIFYICRAFSKFINILSFLNACVLSMIFLSKRI